MKRLTVRADEVKRGDAVPSYDCRPPRPKELLVEVVETSGDVVEVWTDQADDLGVGMPCLTFAPSDPVEVWR